MTRATSCRCFTSPARLARAGELPVNVRVLVEGEEECGSESVGAWLREDERGADAAIVFDSAMADASTPAITVGLRGIVMLDLTVRTAERNLHSGIYGGSVLNAMHALQAILAAVLPAPDGELRAELREGALAPSAAELDSWARLPPAAELFAEAGARPVSERRRGRLLPPQRRGALARRPPDRGRGGADDRAGLAQATISLRLAPGQDPRRMSEVLERCSVRPCPPVPSSRSRARRPPPRSSSSPTARRCGSRPPRWSAPAGSRPRSCAAAAASRSLPRWPAAATP